MGEGGAKICIYCQEISDPTACLFCGKPATGDYCSAECKHLDVTRGGRMNVSEMLDKYIETQGKGSTRDALNIALARSEATRAELLSLAKALREQDDEWCTWCVNQIERIAAVARVEEVQS